MLRRSFLSALAVLPLLFAGGTAAALTLDEARAEGLVGERPDGYVAPVVPDPPPEVRELVERVNAERRRVYEELARREGVPVEAVAAITAKKIVERLPPGAYWMDEKGQWHRK